MKKNLFYFAATALMLVGTIASAVSDPCVVESKHGEAGTWTEGACYGSSGSCSANICKNIIM